jgi:hydroxymethylglutaryl-CoA lyase
VEVGPRDGLQNEQKIVPTEAKVLFVNALSHTGLREIEVSSFVSPKWVPQLADAAELFASIERVEGIAYSALVPNEIGMERAMAARVDKIAVFTAASEMFNLTNLNATISDSIRGFESFVSSANVPVRGYVSTAFYCPFEGKVEARAVSDVVHRMLDIGCNEISLGDTIGRASKDDVSALLNTILATVEPVKVAMHFHDTFGNAIENILVSEEFGIRTFDGSAGGLGGCPFAPGAPGNVSTAAIVQAFPSRTGVSLEGIQEAAELIRPFVGNRPID